MGRAAQPPARTGSVVLHLIDGSNLLGRMRLDRESDEMKRRLVAAVSSLLRGRQSRGVLFFDGAAPSPFATRLGHLTVRFAGTRSADDLIKEAAREGQPCCVVTSDQRLAAAVAGRRVRVVSADTFARELEQAHRDGERPIEDDWENYFSDDKNRNI